MPCREAAVSAAVSGLRLPGLGAAEQAVQAERPGASRNAWRRRL
ncbi:MAG: hypothetical protein ACLS9N_08910 [[Clostridium] leptum]